MFIDIGRGLVAGLPALALPPAILDAVERGAWIVFNLSGGKDSSAAMFAVNLILDALGHPRERRIAIHADLGRAEWDETPATVEDLAAHAGVPLTIVRRNAGDLFDRWATRFANGKARYEALETYNLIGPWSSSALRFCTSEMKAHVIGPHSPDRCAARLSSTCWDCAATRASLGHAHPNGKQTRATPLPAIPTAPR